MEVCFPFNTRPRRVSSEKNRPTFCGSSFVQTAFAPMSGHGSVANLPLRGVSQKRTPNGMLKGNLKAIGARTHL